MSGLPTGLRRDLPLAAVAAATTWLTMLSWRGFSDLWGQFMTPLLLVAIVVPLTGAALRATALPRRAGFLLHVILVALLVWVLLGGSALHPAGSTAHLAARVADGWVSAQTYTAPIPQDVASIAPLLVPCGALALLVVDGLACWLRRVPLAGLPLLAIYCVPISVIGNGVSWVVFVLGACGFLLMMFLHESAHITRWGRPLGGSAAVADPHGFGVRTGASKASATTVAGVSLVLAVLLPAFVPTLHLDGLGLFGPGGSGSSVKVVNPVVDMRRNLQRGRDVPLLTVRTDDPDPSYLRIAVLTQFNGVQWSSGNRALISNQLASGLLPFAEEGLSSSVPIRPRSYTVTATSAFASRWLPTEFPVLSVTAAGDWHWDASTMDFIAGDSSTTTAGLTWTMTALKPQLSNYSMINSLTAPSSIQQAYTSTPSTLPKYVGELAAQVTRSGGSRFERAVLLQDWFRTHFRYSLKRASGDGNDALLQFLSPGRGGRVGYCEQFAAAYAVMARTLGIPARVAVGFLHPQQVGSGRYVYSAYDMHAWPELYFRGSGWVTFEPTPASSAPGGAGGVPAYTTGAVRKPRLPGKGPTSAGGRLTTDPTSSTRTHLGHQRSTSTAAPGAHVPWAAIGLGVLVALALATLGLVPGAARRRRRAHRLAGGIEAAWAELRDSAVDLGVAWPVHRSPHETGHALAAWFGAEPDGPPRVRPPRGRGLAPRAEEALDRVVLRLERVRYAPYAEDRPGAAAEDVLCCVTALEHGSTLAALRRARWLPRSLFGGQRAAVRAERQREPEAVAAGGVVDHVG